MEMVVAYAGFGMLATLLETALDVEADAGRRLSNVAAGVLAFLVTWAAAWILSLARLPRGLALDATGWTGWAVVAAAFLQVSLYDLLYALWHRAQHAVPALWRVHRFHHSDDAYDATTYLRQHPLEGTLQTLLLVAPLSVALAIPPQAAFAAGLFSAALDYWNHLGARIGHGPLTRLVSGPQLHRHHHARDPRLAAGNYAAVLPLWDMAMGTYVHPRGDAWPDVGLWSPEAGKEHDRDSRVATGRGGTASAPTLAPEAGA